MYKKFALMVFVAALVTELQSADGIFGAGQFLNRGDLPPMTQEKRDRLDLEKRIFLAQQKASPFKIFYDSYLRNYPSLKDIDQELLDSVIASDNQAIKKLLDAGANPNVYYRSKNIADELNTDYKIQIDDKILIEMYNPTALMIAANNNNAVGLRYLIEAGADPRIKNEGYYEGYNKRKIKLKNERYYEGYYEGYYKIEKQYNQFRTEFYPHDVTKNVKIQAYLVNKARELNAINPTPDITQQLKTYGPELIGSSFVKYANKDDETASMLEKYLTPAVNIDYAYSDDYRSLRNTALKKALGNEINPPAMHNIALLLELGANPMVSNSGLNSRIPSRLSIFDDVLWELKSEIENFNFMMEGSKNRFYSVQTFENKKTKIKQLEEIKTMFEDAIVERERRIREEH